MKLLEIYYRLRQKGIRIREEKGLEGFQPQRIG